METEAGGMGVAVMVAAMVEEVKVVGRVAAARVAAAPPRPIVRKSRPRRG